jgi:hypothetical protein
MTIPEGIIIVTWMLIVTVRQLQNESQMRKMWNILKGGRK